MCVNFLSTYSDKKSCHRAYLNNFTKQHAGFVSDSWAYCYLRGTLAKKLMVKVWFMNVNHCEWKPLYNYQDCDTSATVFEHTMCLLSQVAQ